MLFNDKNGFVTKMCVGQSVLPLYCVKVDHQDQIRESSVSTNLLQSNSRPTEKYPDSKPDRARAQTVKRKNSPIYYFIPNVCIQFIHIISLMRSVMVSLNVITLSDAYCKCTSIIPGQLINAGTLIPPSQVVPLPHRRSPAQPP